MMVFDENGNSVRGVNLVPSIVLRARANDGTHARNRAARHGEWAVERDRRELREKRSIGGGVCFQRNTTTIGLLKWLDAGGVGVIIVAVGLEIAGGGKEIRRQDALY